MRRWKLCVAVALLLAFGNLLRAEPEAERKPAPRPGSTSAWSRWLRGEKPAEAKPQPRSTKDDDKDDKDDKQAKDSQPTNRSKQTLENRMARERDRAKAEYLRRLEAWIRLMQIADETRDESLRRVLEPLDQRVYNIYQERLQRLPERHAAHELDEETLDKHLGSKPGYTDTKSVRSQTKPQARSRTAAREED